MHRVELHYTLRRDAREALLRHPLFDLLRAVDAHGSISAAARALGLSYRHVWGALKRWEQELGQALIVWEKGQHARLSPFGAKLMWAERQAQARLAPQIEALRAELEHAFAAAFDPNVQWLALHASHDDALVALRAHAARHAGLHLDLRFTGSVDAIAALNEGRCIMAGFHVRPQAPRDSISARAYRNRLRPGRHKLIGFARRTQGLIVAPGNPLRLTSLRDAAARQARFVLRSIGSGTRVLLHELLAAEGLPEDALAALPRAETSHSAVAEVVAAGDADAALGIEAAARARGLGFVPLADEHYYLVCLQSALEHPAVRALRAALATPAWQAQLAQWAGYAPWRSGEVLSLRAELPWWRFKNPRPEGPH
ncbi:MAG: substrate-binding domain-containing protein [Pseudomonadota bacterium]